jgi:hypothetical protein
VTERVRPLAAASPPAYAWLTRLLLFLRPAPPQAHKSTVWVGAHLPQNRELFATTGGNGSVNVYK